MPYAHIKPMVIRLSRILLKLETRRKAMPDWRKAARLAELEMRIDEKLSGIVRRAVTGYRDCDLA